MRRWWVLGGVGGFGAALQVGAAALRLDTFWPYPQLLDFACDYVGAWAFRRGVSPYRWSPDFLEELRTAHGVSIEPPPLFSAPIIPWLLQPLTFMPFPAASTLWLLVLLGLMAWSAGDLAQLADCTRRRNQWVAFIAIFTFGPVFLTLTLGQNSLFLLVAVLALGKALRVERAPGLRSALLLVAAVAFKLFPVFWLGALPLLRRWRLGIGATAAVVITFGLHALLVPDANREYWLEWLPPHLSAYSKWATLDDQSLTAWIDRLGRPQQLGVHGFATAQQRTVEWTPPWSIDPDVLHAAALVLIVLLIPILVTVLVRAPASEAEGAFYLWVLFGLAVIPHMQRYDHVLMLPSMAWLWTKGDAARSIVIVAYAATGVARLTHLWALLLSAPWGPLASGFGLYAVVLLGAAMLARLSAARATGG